MNVWTIIIGLLMFCFIIVIHELGHFTAAKIFGMRVHEFSLGMGPVLLKKRGKETIYSLKLLPIGGSVQLGEDEEATDERDFRNKPVWQRMIVILAGAFMNLIFGLIVCLIMVAVSDRVVTTQIAGFTEGATSNSMLQIGDEIIKINNLNIYTTSDISYQLTNSESKITADENSAKFDFLVKRNGEKILLQDVTFAAKVNESGGKSIVFDFKVYSTDKTFLNVITTGFKEYISIGRLIILSLVDMFRGTYGINDFSGPVGVVEAIGQVAAVDPMLLITLVALITINVGIFNLLPVPALDGMRFVFMVIEAIRRKPVKAEIEGMVHFVGFAALMVLMVVVTFNDIHKIFVR